MFQKLIDEFKKALKEDFSTVSTKWGKTTSRTVRVEGDNIWVNGKKINTDEAKEEVRKETTIKDGETYRIGGDVIGMLTLKGDNITVVIEGDNTGVISGATKVVVEGDSTGISI